MKKQLLLWLSLLVSGMLSAQINTEGAFGGTENDSITFVSPLNAGNGYLIMGYTNSYTPDPEIFIMKTDLAGNPLWSKNFFLNNTQNEPIAICEGNDGGVVVVFANNGINEVFVAKYNETSGAFDWAKRNSVFINQKGAYDFVSIDANNDGQKDGYVLSIYSTNSDRGQLLLLNNNGEVTAKQSEQLWDVDITDFLVADDNRLMAAGRRNGGDEVLLLELDYNDLSIVDAGSRSYASIVRESNSAKVDFVKMAQAGDGSFVLIAHHSNPSMNQVGRIIIKTDSDGNNPVTYEYGLENVDDFYLTDVAATSSGFLFAGYTGSGYSNSFGQKDIIFVRTDLSMELQEASIFGGELDDAARFVFENSDNSVTIFANSNSFSKGNNNDFYIIKTSENAASLCNEQDVAFSIQVADVSIVGNSNVFNTTDNVSAATDLTDNYEFKDITLTAYCACTIDLSFETSGFGCTGEPIMFSNPGDGLGYEWDFGDGALDPVNEDGTIYVPYETPGIKFITLDVPNNSCIKSATKSVIVFKTPEVDITYDSEQNNCEGKPFTFTNNGSSGNDYTFNWDFGNMAETRQSNEEVAHGIVYKEGTEEATVTLTVANEQCKTTDTETITVVPMAVPDFEATATQCTGESIDFTYTGTTPNSLDFDWEFAGAETTSSSSVNPEDVVYEDKGIKSILLTVTTADGCVDTVRKEITIAQTPIITGITSTGEGDDDLYCVKSGISFTADVEESDDDQWQYSWDFGTDADNQFSSAEEPAGILFTAAGDKTITLTVNSDKCASSFSDDIEIFALPVSLVIADTTICPDTQVALSSDESAVPSDHVYSWNIEDASILSDATVANPDAMPVAEFTVYSVTITDGNGCITTDSVNVTMLPALQALVGDDEEICRNDDIQIGAYPIEGIIYEWESANGLELTDMDIANPVVQPTETTIYTLHVSYANKPACESVSDQVRVIVNQLPEVVATDYMLQDTTDIALGSSVQLIASGAVQYEWTPAEGLTNAGIYNPEASPEDSTLYTVKGIDVYGCINYDSVQVNVIVPTTWIPTAFSPNGDDLNDVFIIRATEATTFTLQIFTRSGEQVYISGDQYEGWDGTNQGTGEELPQGAYVYYTKGELTNGELFEEKGIINLVR